MQAPADGVATAPAAAVLAFYNVSEAVTGGMRRVNELLTAIGPERVTLFQPGLPHPAARTFTIRPDLGRRRVGINWGMFNFFWPITAARVRHDVAALEPSCLLLTSIWGWAPFARRETRLPMILDAQNVDAAAIAERYGAGHPFTRLVERWERRTAAAAALIITCSDVDRQGFIDRYGTAPGRIVTVPNGADCPDAAALAVPAALDPALEQRLAGKTVCLFVGGKLDYPPNAEGLRFLNERVAPALARDGEYVVLVVGVPTPTGSLHPSLIPVGRVPTLAPYLRRADICLAPVFSGSGTRLKVLDYFAWGKPVVASAKAVEGIACRDGVHYKAAGRDDFTDTVIDLRANMDKAANYGRAARELIRARYDWRAVRNAWQTALAPWLPPSGRISDSAQLQSRAE